MSEADGVENGADSRAHDLREQVGRDPRLAPEERETTVTFATDEDTARVHTDEPALVRRLLAHDHVDVDDVGVYDDGTVRTVAYDAVVADGGVDGRITRLRGRVLVDCLVVKSQPRTTGGHAQVVSKEVFRS